MNAATARSTHTLATDSLSERLDSKLSNPATSPDFDLHDELSQVLADVGMTTSDSGGNLSFYGQDPILPSRIRFGSMAAIGLAAKSIAVAALWKQRTGEGQDISVDVRKGLKRFYGFFEGKWEKINGRPPAGHGYSGSPFMTFPLFRETRDGRHVVPLDFYPRLRTRTLKLLRCGESVGYIQKAILQWRADELESAAAEAGVVMAMVRTNEEFRKELQYTEVLAKMPLITVEKIGESE